MICFFQNFTKLQGVPIERNICIAQLLWQYTGLFLLKGAGLLRLSTNILTINKNLIESQLKNTKTFC